MKVIIATPLYPPEPGGPATYSKLLEEGLPLRGIEVTLVKFGDVKHWPKGIRHALYFFNVWKAARHADAIYALDAVSVGYPAMRAAQLLGKPFAVKIVGDYAWEQGVQRHGISQTLEAFVAKKNVPPELLKYRRIQTRVARGARFVVVPSRYLETIVRAWGIPPERIKVIYNSISRKEIEKPGEALSAAVDLPRPLLVAVGRLVPWKNVDGIIDAVHRLRDDGLQISLAVIGAGPEAVALKQKAASALPSDRWLFGGALSHASVLATMAKADVFVLNSSYEGLSHVLIEASLLGVPIVATRVGGNPEVVEDGENGLLVPPGDTKSLASAVARILSDEGLRERMKSANNKLADRFSDTAMLDATAGLLKNA